MAQTFLSVVKKFLTKTFPIYTKFVLRTTIEFSKNLFSRYKTFREKFEEDHIGKIINIKRRFRKFKIQLKAKSKKNEKIKKFKNLEVNEFLKKLNVKLKPSGNHIRLIQTNVKPRLSLNHLKSLNTNRILPNLHNLTKAIKKNYYLSLEYLKRGYKLLDKTIHSPNFNKFLILVFFLLGAFIVEDQLDRIKITQKVPGDEKAVNINATSNTDLVFEYDYELTTKTKILKYIINPALASDENQPQLVLTDHDGKKHNPEFVVDREGEESFSVRIALNKIPPGAYEALLEVYKDGVYYQQEKDFTYGVLSINTNKATFVPGEVITLNMGALKNDGHTICDATLELKITSPSGKESNPNIEQSGFCERDNVTNVPDYLASHKAEEVGRHKMTLVNKDNGYQIEDYYEVQTEIPFSIERKGPSRIYPFVAYPMEITVTANQDFTGKIIERVPKGFLIKGIETSDKEEWQTITWDVDLKNGEKATYTYFFDAPDISPFLYLIGPLAIGEYQEVRMWQIASDADGSGTNVVVPTGVLVSSTDQTFTFTYDPSELFNSGELAIKVPTSRGWSTPQGSAGTAGYTTVSGSGNTTIGEVLVSGDSTSQGVWTLTEDDSDMCNTTASPFVDTTTKKEGSGAIQCNNSGSAAPDDTDTFSFDATAQNWSSYTQISFWLRSTKALTSAAGIDFGYDNNAAFGSPTAIFDTGTVSANTWTYFVFDMTGTRTGITAFGLICNTTGCDNNTFWLDEVMVGPSSPTFVANGPDVDIRARFIDLASTDTVTVTYGAGGGTSGADVPVTSGLDEFTTRTRFDAGGTLTNISSHPTVNVENPSINISGSCKQDDQTTNCTDTGTIKVAINGSIQAQVQNTVAGTWTISGITSPNSGDVVTVFIDGAGEADEAVAVTTYDGSGNVEGMELIEQRMTIGNNDNRTISNVDLAAYDNGVSGDEDIFHEIDGSNDLTMIEASKPLAELYIKTGNTYRPASDNTGNVTVNDFEIPSGAIFTSDANTITIKGDSTPFVVGGTFNENTSTLKYTSSSATTITPETYYHLSLEPSAAGSPTYTLNSGTYNTRNLTIGNGTNPVTVNWTTNDPTINVGGNLLLNANSTWTKSDTATLTFNGATTPVTLTDNNSIKQDLGKLSIDGPKEVDVGSSVTLESINVTAGDTLDLQSSGNELEITGSGIGASRPFINDGSTNFGNSTVIYLGTETTEIQANYATGYYNLTLDQPGTTFTATDICRVSNGFIIENGEYSPGSSTLEIMGGGYSFLVNDTFTAGTSTVVYSGTSNTNIALVDYYNLGIYDGFTTSSRTFTMPSGTVNIFNNLTVGSSSGITNITLDVNTNDPVINVTGNMLIQTYGVYLAASNQAYPLSVAGDFFNNGTFTHNNGKVVLNSGVDTSQSLLGTVSFHTLEIATGDREVKLGTTGTKSIVANGSFTLTGTDCSNMMRFRSSSSGDQATLAIDVSATASVSLVDLQDINLTTKSITAGNSVNSGNNSANWTVSANACIGTSTNQDTTGSSFQRKVIYDDQNTRYWSFNHDGDEIEVKYSDDGGSTWQPPTTEASGHLAYDTNDFSVWWKSISTTEYIVLAVNDGGVIKLRQGTLTASDITWDGDVSTALTGTGDYSYPYVTFDSSNYIWVGARYSESSNNNFQTVMSDQLVTTDPSTWTWTTSYQLSENSTSGNVYGTVEPLSSQNMYATFVVDTGLLGCKWDSTGSQWVDSADASCEAVVSSGQVDSEAEFARASGPNKIDDAGDPGTMPGAGGQIVQTSTGNLYSFINNGGSCEVWKSTDGSSWSEQDSSNNPLCISATTIAAAIKSDDTIGLSYVVTGSPHTIKYRNFDTNTDQFQTEETAANSSSSGTAYEVSIEIDSADTPHIVYKYQATMNQYIFYVNKVGGSWNTTVSVAGGEGSNVNSVDITLDGNDIPIISYYFGALFDLYVASGNARNATSFSNNAIDTNAAGGTAIDIDTQGNVWIAYQDSSSISLAQHLVSDSWSTWSTITSKTDVGSNLSISVIGKTVVVFYQDDSSDQKAVYDIYDSGTSSWLGETTLASTGSIDYQNVKVKQSRYNQVEPWKLDYVYSNGTDIYWDYVDLRPVKIDDASDFQTMTGASRAVVRTKSGTIYSFITRITSCEMWKSTNGINWVLANATSISCTPSMTALAIDSSDNIHVAYLNSLSIRYRKFITSTDAWDVSGELTIHNATDSLKEVSISVDSNDKPHAAFITNETLDSGDNEVGYSNAISGTWKSRVVVEASTNYQLDFVDITIDEDNVPLLSYVHSTDGDLSTAGGNQNDATSFSVYDVDVSVNTTAEESGASIGVDTLTGKTWVAYVDSTGAISMALRADGNESSLWGSNWSTITSKTDVGYEPSIAFANNGDIYVFYENDQGDIAYDIYDPVATSWVGEIVLHEGTFRDVKAKWSFESNNFGVNTIDYLFSDGTDIYWDFLYLRKEPVIIDNVGDAGTFTGMGSRVLRTSDGTLYITFNNNGDLEVWKSLDGRTFVEMDSGDGPTDINAPDEVATAIDSSDIIHIIYVNNTDPEDVNYVTFDTSTDQFATSETAINVFTTGNSFRGIDISIDSNDIPHVVGARYGTQNRIYYGNRIGGSWNSIDDVYTGVALWKPSLTLNEDNIPEISFFDSSNDDLVAALGNANNATTFTSQVVESTILASTAIQATDIGIDSSGNTWITYIDDSTQYVSLIKHNDADAWTSWQTEVNNSRIGSTPSLAIQGTDIYVFYENTQDDIVHDLYDGSSWSGENILEQHGALQDVKVKWSLLNNNDSTGTPSGGSEVDYVYSDGTDIYYNRLNISIAAVPVSNDTIASGLASSTTQNFSTVKSTVSTTDYIHAVYVNSTGNIYYDRYDGDWDYVNSSLDTNTDNAYIGLSKDSATSDVYLGYIGSTSDDIFTKKATYSAGPSWSWGTSTTLVTDASEIYTNYNANYTGNGKIGAIYSIGDLSPYNIGWESVLSATANNAPTIDNVVVNGGSNISLTAGSTHNVSWTATITDLDGNAEIAGVTGKLYRSGVAGAESCTANNNNCYADAVCDLTGCAGNTCTATCTVAMYFHADATDANSTMPSEYWRGWMEATDSHSDTGSEFSSINTPDVESLSALDIVSTVDYGLMLAGDSSTEQATLVTNRGNIIIDLELSGDNMCTDYPTCAGSMISVGQQEYSMSTFTYGGGSDLTTSAVRIQFNLAKPTTSPSNATKNLYWRLGLNSEQTVGEYSGSNVVLSENDNVP